MVIRSDTVTKKYHLSLLLLSVIQCVYKNLQQDRFTAAVRLVVSRNLTKPISSSLRVWHASNYVYVSCNHDEQIVCVPVIIMMYLAIK